MSFLIVPDGTSSIVIFLDGKAGVIGPRLSNLGGTGIDGVFWVLFQFLFPFISILYRIEPSND